MPTIRRTEHNGNLIERLKRVLKGGLQDHPEDSKDVGVAKRQGLCSKQLTIKMELTCQKIRYEFIVQSRTCSWLTM